jgi:hypothetical protein
VRARALERQAQLHTDEDIAAPSVSVRRAPARGLPARSAAIRAADADGTMRS